MKTFVTTDHDTFWPVGSASVAVAESEEQARTMIDQQLRDRGLKDSTGSPYTLREIQPASAEVLRDGNY